MAVFFDMEKAYDMMWREGLLIKLCKLGVDTYITTFWNSWVDGLIWHNIWKLPRKYLLTNKVKYIYFKLVYKYYPSNYFLVNRFNCDTDSLCILWSTTYIFIYFGVVLTQPMFGQTSAHLLEIISCPAFNFVLKMFYLFFSLTTCHSIRNII